MRPDSVRIVGLFVAVLRRRLSLSLIQTVSGKESLKERMAHRLLELITEIQRAVGSEARGYDP